MITFFFVDQSFREGEPPGKEQPTYHLRFSYVAWGLDELRRRIAPDFRGYA
jgi:hypothetical protein